MTEVIGRKSASAGTGSTQKRTAENNKRARRNNIGPRTNKSIAQASVSTKPTSTINSEPLHNIWIVISVRRKYSNNQWRHQTSTAILQDLLVILNQGDNTASTTYLPVDGSNAAPLRKGQTLQVNKLYRYADNPSAIHQPYFNAQLHVATLMDDKHLQDSLNRFRRNQGAGLAIIDPLQSPKRVAIGFYARSSPAMILRHYISATNRDLTINEYPSVLLMWDTHINPPTSEWDAFATVKPASALVAYSHPDNVVEATKGLRFLYSDPSTSPPLGRQMFFVPLTEFWAQPISFIHRILNHHMNSMMCEDVTTEIKGLRPLDTAISDETQTPPSFSLRDLLMTARVDHEVPDSPYLFTSAEQSGLQTRFLFYEEVAPAARLFLNDLGASVKTHFGIEDPTVLIFSQASPPLPTPVSSLNPTRPLARPPTCYHSSPESRPTTHPPGTPREVPSHEAWLDEAVKRQNETNNRHGDYTVTSDGNGGIPLYSSPPVTDGNNLVDPFGDPSHGDVLLSHESFRYLFQNVRGKLKTTAQKSSACRSLSDTKCNAFGIAESNLHWSSKHRTKFDSSLGSIWTNSRSAFSSCPLDPSVTHVPDHLPGGTCQSIQGAYSGRITDHGSDPMGRWSYQRLALKGSKHLLLITAYRPCSQTVEQGFSTSTAQQHRFMSSRGVKDFNPRQRFLVDLLDFITDWQTKGDEVLLGIDANPSNGTDNQLEAFLAASNMVDLYEYRHGSPAPSTHNGGRTLDFLYGTKLLQEALLATGVCREQEGLDSDHRAIFGDFDTRILFDNKNDDPTRPSRRNLKLKNRQAVLAYRESFVAKSAERGILQRLYTLQLTIANEAYDMLTVIAEYESIDVDITWAMLSAEKEVTTGSSGKHPFSPAFSDAGNAIRHWKRQIRLTESSASIDHVLIPSQVYGIQSFTHYLEFCRLQLSLSWKEFRAIKMESSERRKKYLDACLVDAIDEVHRANTLRKIISAEAAAKLYSRIRFYVKGGAASSISYVLVPDESDPSGYKRVSEKEPLFRAILQRNLQHFGQAADTPFVNGSQGERLPPFSYTDEHENLLHGTYHADNAEYKEVQQFVDALKRPAGVHDLSTHYGTEDFIAGWRGISEKTSSSPSGRYIGLYKALIDNYDENEDTVNIFSIMSSIPINVGFCPIRWAKALQVMLCKKEGDLRLHRLRVIQLLEADLNMVFRYFWGRQMVHNAQRLKLIPSIQFGNQAGLMANSCHLLKVFSAELIRVTRALATIFNNDAQACYDRMIPSLSQVACRRLGLAREQAVFMLAVLLAMQYHARTAHGMSAEFYSNEDGWVLGTLQGSGASPSIWLAVFIVLALAFIKEYPGSFGWDPRHLHELFKSVEAFVDDADLWYVAFASDNTDEARITMQQMAQKWERLLFVSGGALGLEKCFWWMLSWKWIDGLPYLRSIAESPGDIAITSGNSPTTTVIKRLEPTEGVAALGPIFTPNGDPNNQYQTLLATAKVLNQRIASSPLNRLEAQILLEQFVQPKIGYPLAASILTEAQCLQIDRLLLPAIISKMGYNRNSHHAVLYGPIHLGAVGIMRFWMIQGLSHVDYLIGHLRLEDIVGKFLLTLIDYYYLLFGIQLPLFTYPTSELKSLRPPFSWVCNTWDFLGDADAQFECTSSLHLPNQRDGDCSLMAQILQHYGGVTANRINAVRLFLQVFMLSDIATSDGLSIDPSHLWVERHRSRPSTLKWPYQIYPPSSCWKAWRTAINKCFVATVLLPLFRPAELSHPLGTWHPGKLKTQKWATVLHDGRVLSYRDDRWYHLPLAPHTHHRVLKTHTIRADAPPPDATPVTLLPIPDSLLHLAVLPTSPRYELDPVIPPIIPTSFQQLLSALPVHEQAVIGHISYPADIDSFFESILNSSVAMASDGSISGSRCSHGWILDSLLPAGPSIAGHTVDQFQDATTARVEGLGHLACLYIYRAILQWFRLSHDEVTAENVRAYIDNKAVISRLSNPSFRSVKRALQADFDITCESLSVINSLPIKVEQEHVKSHKFDNAGPEVIVPYPNRLNKICDEACTAAYLCQDCRAEPPDVTFPSTKCFLLVGGRRFPGRSRSYLRQRLMEQSTKEYLMEVEEWSLLVFDNVAWLPLEKATRRRLGGNRRAVHKLMFRLQPNLCHRHKCGGERSLDRRCPRCQTFAHEDFEHVYQCRSPPAVTTRIAAMETLTSSLLKYEVDTYFSTAITSGLRDWLDDTVATWPHQVPHANDNYAVMVYDAFYAQDQIGWSNLMRGRISSTWFAAYDYRCESLSLDGKMFRSHVFGPALVEQLWQFSLTVWKERCDSMYGPTGFLTRRNLDELTYKISSAYNDRDSIPLSLRVSLFSTPLQTLLDRPLTVRQQWLAHHDRLSDFSATVIAPTEPLPRNRALHSFFRQFPCETSIDPAPD